MTEGGSGHQLEQLGSGDLRSNRAGSAEGLTKHKKKSFLKKFEVKIKRN